MADKPHLKFFIHPDGKVKVEVDGVEGSVCTDLAKPFEDAIGITKEQELKAEYYMEGSATVNQL